MSRDRIDGLRDAAEIAVTACLPLLPLRGSWNSGYKVEEKVGHTLIATPEEWAEAAHAVAALHNAITHTPLEAPMNESVTCTGDRACEAETHIDGCFAGEREWDERHGAPKDIGTVGTKPSEWGHSYDAPKEHHTRSDRFALVWDKHSGQYKVNVPDFDAGEVVRAEAYDRLQAEAERLREIIANGPDWGEQYLREMDERKRQGDRAHKWKTRAEALAEAVEQHMAALDPEDWGCDPLWAALTEFRSHPKDKTP